MVDFTQVFILSFLVVGCDSRTIEEVKIAAVGHNCLEIQLIGARNECHSWKLYMLVGEEVKRIALVARNQNEEPPLVYQTHWLLTFKI